jgi:short-subunit dehydrogenase
MPRELNGRRMVITGASSGIGRSLAELAAQRGARLALAARSADKLDEVVRLLRRDGAEAIAVPTDITVAADRQRLIQTVADHYGGLDILVNNAGVASYGHFANSSEAILRRIMEVNFFAPTELIRLAIPLLTTGQQPAVVNVASMCGRRGVPGWPEYSASKFALCGMAEALRAEMARFEIDVLLIVPGLTNSPFATHFLRNEGRAKIDYAGGMPTESVAAKILEALTKSRGETVLGREAKALLTLHKYLPGFVDWAMRRHIRKLYAQPESVRA